MKDAFDVIGWLGDNVIAPFVSNHVTKSLISSGLGQTLAILLATILVVGLGKLLWFSVLPEPEPDWTKLDPDDSVQMRLAYQKLHVASRLAVQLDEDVAITLNEFIDQIRRLGLFRSPFWYRIDANDEELMRSLYEQPGVSDMLARRLSTKAAASPEQFSDQVRRVQQPESL